MSYSPNFDSGLSDVLVDLTCEYEPMVPDGGDPEASYMAHGGMLYVSNISHSSLTFCRR
jgi:hypothetical protein